MTVMFDLDGTWSADIKLMRAIAALCIAAGHVIVMITGRKGTEDDRKLVEVLVKDQSRCSSRAIAPSGRLRRKPVTGLTSGSRTTQSW